MSDVALKPAAMTPEQMARLEAEVCRLTEALEEIAHPPYGIGFRGLKSIAIRALGRNSARPPKAARPTESPLR